MNSNKLLVTFLVVLLLAGGTGLIYYLLNKNDDTDTTVPVTRVDTDTDDEDADTLIRNEKNLNDTNQLICYNNESEITCPNEGGDFFGQDANYAGSDMSFQDNGDGTVSDLTTGLMWQQDPGEKVSYSEAVSGVDSFNLAGHSDWRLPSIKELYSLIDFNGLDPSGIQGSDTSGFIPFINDEVFKFSYGDESNGERLIDSQWVTSSVYESTVMGREECFFGVNFADGRIKCYPTANRGPSGYFVIYVRGDIYGENKLFRNQDGTITDDATGLMWMSDDGREEMNWQEALSFCEDLISASKDDWRLPNAKELQSIVDYSRSPDTTNSAAIDPIFETSTITNEAGEQDYPFYWTSTTHANQQGGRSAAYVSFGRAMGYMQGQWMDVHGAGAQRSDPKDGDPSEYPEGHGPQGDAIRILNYVRCVREI